MRLGTIARAGAAGTTLPPSGLTATPVGSNRVDLAWNPLTGAPSYTVERSLDGLTGWSVVGTAAGTTFSNTGLNAATTYYYRVRPSPFGLPTLPAAATTGP